METEHASSDILRKEILEQSQSEAEGISEQAERERSRLLDQARKDAGSLKLKILKDAKVQADSIRKKVLSTVHLDVKKLDLKNREQALTRVIGEVRRKLEDFRQNPEYSDVLKIWLLEAASALEGDQIELRAGETEKKILEGALGDIADQISKTEKRKITLKIHETPLNDGGILAISGDGRMRFDNSFTALLRRKEDEMRLMILKDVLS